MLAALLLAGCGAIRHQPSLDDSPLPRELAALPACSEAPLRPGGRCIALVRADAWWPDTGVRACAGQTYRITVPPGQRWFDLNRVNEPPFGEPGSVLMNLFARYKRHRGVAWFSLIAGVTGPPQPGGVRNNQVAVASSGPVPPPLLIKRPGRSGARTKSMYGDLLIRVKRQR